MSGIESGVAAGVDAEETTPRERELGAIISAYNEVTERLKLAHERLEREVARLRQEVAAKNRELERRKRLAALGEMAAGLAHEIRNPLGGIVLFASLLEQDLSDRPDQLKLVGKIHKGVRSLEGIVSDILAFSRPGEVDRRWVRLGSIVDQAVDLAWPRFQQLGVRLDVAESVGPMEVYADAGRLERALLNLLLNGAEACAEGGWVWVRARRAGEEAVEIEVADSGAGIAPEAMERIFNPFFTTKETGTGLGLAIVHRIVESHGGSIQAANRPGGGAAIRIRLPLLKGAAGCVREG
jgi:signal transduction histidine kinase